LIPTCAEPVSRYLSLSRVICIRLNGFHYLAKA